MRLFKKISQERFIELKTDSEPNSNLNYDNLNYYIVIEFDNAFDAVDYDKMFPENSMFVDFQSLQKEHMNIISKIKKQIDSKKVPIFLKKLGVTNIIKGCYLIASKNKDLPKNIKKNSKNFITYKLDYKNLPKEVSDMCDEYYSKNAIHISKEKEDFDAFFKLTIKEQEKEMLILFQHFSNYTNKSILFSAASSENLIKTGGTNSNLTLEELFEKNLNSITDSDFLEQLFKRAKLEENYELCSKIQQRLEFLKNNTPNP